MQTRHITTLTELNDIGKEVLEGFVTKDRAQVIALSGELGAGKTAFVKELGKLLNVEEVLASPTFVIMKSYAIPNHPFLKTLTHIDAYRIETEDEMRVLKLDEILSDPKRLVCIEWPEKIGGLIPKDAVRIEFILQLDGTRDITLPTYHG
jgi:tRNA threonylcarbamoyladenosine biosynthesis protein TsaE